MSIMGLDNRRAGSLIKGIWKFYGIWNTKAYLGGTNEGRINTHRTETLILDLYKINDVSYSNKYNEPLNIIEPKLEGEPFDKYQTLKTLKCLRYNIEEEFLEGFKIRKYDNYFGDLIPIQTTEDVLKVTDILINELINNIVRESEEFKAALWG